MGRVTNTPRQRYVCYTVVMSTDRHNEDNTLSAEEIVGTFGCFTCIFMVVSVTASSAALVTVRSCPTLGYS